MALVVKDRVKVTTTTTGTGTLTLGSAVAKFQDFSVIGDGNTTYYAIESGTDWEVGVGTYTASGTTLSRDTILESSNAGSAINLSGTSTVFCTYPAERSVNTEDIGVTVQAYDADTAKLDVVQTFTAAQTFSTDATINGLTVGKGANSVSTNTALGVSALSAITTGASNVAIGSNAARYTTTASNSVGIGQFALYVNNGSANVAIGRSSMEKNTTGVHGVALGYYSLLNNTTGSYNTALGSNALLSNTTASNNTAVGYQAMYFNTTGGSNVAIGTFALYKNDTTSNSVAIGNRALQNSIANFNTSVGGTAAYLNTSGQHTVALGYNALYYNTTSSNNVAIGSEALLNTTGANNTALGRGTGSTLTTGSNNTLLGHNAEPSSATVSNEITLGDASVTDVRIPGVGFYIDGGNVGIGTSSPATTLEVDSGSGANGISLKRESVATDTSARLFFDSSASTFSIFNSLGNLRISSGATVGSSSGTERMRITSTGNVGIGTSSPGSILDVQAASGVSMFRLTATTGTNAVYSRYSNTGGYLYLGRDNSSGTDFGSAYAAGIWSTGAYPMLFGTNGTEKMRIDSSGNVGIGTNSPAQKFQVHGSDGGDVYTRISNTDSTTSSGLLIGLNGNEEGVIRVEPNQGLIFGTNSTERMRITSGGEVYIAGTTDQGAYNLQCNGTGVWGAGAYVNGSDERIKQDITPIDTGLDVVAKLNPVTYTYKEEWSKDQSIQTGFIAQDLLIALEGKNYVDGIVQQGGEYMSVAYQNIIPILTKAIQEQQETIKALETRIQTLENK